MMRTMTITIAKAMTIGTQSAIPAVATFASPAAAPPPPPPAAAMLDKIGFPVALKLDMMVVRFRSF